MKKTNNITGIKVPFFPADREFAAIKSELLQAFIEVGESGQLILGPNVQKFEQKITQITQTKHCISCANGTDALTLSLKALKLGSGDEVIVPANSYPTIFGVSLSGVKPVLADVDFETGNLSSESLEKNITPNTKAVVLVHLYGQSAEIEKIKFVCQLHKLFLIEDCAQAFGARYKGKSVGSFGDAATFSFYPTKNLGAYGDGGAVVTSNSQIAERLKRLRTYGESSRYQSQELGHNSRLDELQAAILLRKLKYIDKWLEKRNKLATQYLLGLQDIGDISLPAVSIDNSNSYHLFPIKTAKRDELMSWLSNRGIQVGVHYPHPIHTVPTFKDYAKKSGFSNSELWSANELSLPIHPYLEEDEIQYVIESIKLFFKQ